MLGYEIDILQKTEALRSPLLNGIFDIVTMLGEHAVLVVIIAVLYFMLDKSYAKRLMFVCMASLCINGVVKNFVKRPRPFATGKVSCLRQSTATGYSFPSGHTQSFATWSTALAYSSKRLWTAVLSAAGIAAVAFSRIYLGAHYPTDVIAGAVLGILLSLIFSIAHDKAKDKNVLYCGVLLGLMPFGVLFLIMPDRHFADLYKMLGMLGGLLAASVFEEKYVQLDINVKLWKKLLRTAVGIAIALLIKELLGDAFEFGSLRLQLLSQSVRYFILVFSVMGLYPWLIKKLSI